MSQSDLYIPEPHLTLSFIPRDMPGTCNARVLWKAPCAEPNGLQATASGLWVVDHSEERKVCLLRYSDGGLLHEFQVRTKRGSGITQDPDGNIWVSSTVGFEIICYDPETGKELAAFPTPWLESNPTLPHGLIWADGHLWVATQFPGALVELDPANGEVIHWVRVSGDRTHGIALEGEGLWRLRIKPPSGGDNWAANGQQLDEPWRSSRGLPPLWCVDTNRRAVFRLDPETGGILDAFGVAGPEAHGMTIHDGTFWMCDAETGEVFVLER